MKLTIQLKSRLQDVEGSCLPRSSASVTEMRRARRSYNVSATTKPGTERGRWHRDKVWATKDSAMTFQDLGKTAVVKTLRTTVEGQHPQDMLVACRNLPMFERLGDPQKSRIIFATQGATPWRGTSGSHTCCWRRYGPHERRMQTQDLFRHILPPCGAVYSACLLLCEAFFLMAACVLCFACLQLSHRDVCQFCALSRFTSRFCEDLSEQRSIKVANRAFLRSAE